MLRLQNDVDELTGKAISADLLPRNLAHFKHLCEALPLEERRELLNLLVEEIVIDSSASRAQIKLQPLPIQTPQVDERGRLSNTVQIGCQSPAVFEPGPAP